MTNNNKSAGILLESGTNEIEFLEFGLDEQNYGINVSKIRQVIVFEPEKVVALPAAPACVVGTLCFRGSPIPVIDVRAYFNFKQSAQDVRKLLLVTEFNLFVVAFVVDSVRNIKRCSWKDFRPSNHGAFGNGDDSIVGTIVENDSMMPILDVEAIIANLVPAASITSQADRVHEGPRGPRGEARVVYCEDSKVVQKVLLKSLHDAGFSHVKIFANGVAGLEYLSQNPGEVDIIISDIEMPQMDGLTLCKQVRSQPQFAGVPFLFFSSTVSEEMRRKCQGVGGDAAYSKPEITKLIGEIDQQLQNKR